MKIINNLLASFVLIVISSTFFSCDNQNKNDERTSEDVVVIREFNDLSPKFYNNSDTTYIINFWATTCPPCLKEMPHFNHMEETNNDRAEKIYLVSLDMERDLETRVRPFVDKYDIKPEVILLGDQNYSAWTEKIDTSWMGALPATLIVNGTHKNFSFGAFESFADLESKLRMITESD